MNTFFNIAGLQICLEDTGFLESLNEIELNLLKPFVVENNQRRKPGKELFTVKPIMIGNARLCKGCKIDPQILKTIRDFFSKHDKGNFEEAFKFFRNIYPNFCLNKSAKRDNIIISPLAFVLSDNRRRNIYMVYLDRANYAKHMPFKFLYNLNVLKLILKSILNSRGDGIMLHASSMERHGHGYVFMGPGGSGKSTVINLIAPKKVFSDDISIARKAGSGYKIFPSPWWNYDNYKDKLNRGTPAPLRAIFFIKKAKKTTMKRLNYKDALEALIYSDKEFQQVGFHDNKAGIKNFYLFSQDLLKKIPAFELKVKKWPGFGNEFNKLVKNHLG